MNTTNPPKTIGRYEVLSEIGKGSMGVVYKAQDPQIGRVVAIKMFNDLPLYKSMDKTAQLLTEARSTGRLRHPHIITLFDVVEGDPPYIVMDYVEGDSLDKLIKGTDTITIDFTLRALSQTAFGLDYAHEQGVVHCDIKPANILIDSKEQRVFILDFGVARLLAGSSDDSQDLILGSPAYMAPEQIFPDNYDNVLNGRADLFSLGVVAFEMLTGTRPFPGKDIGALFNSIVNSNRLNFSDLVTGLTSNVCRKVEKVFDRALSSIPDERPENCVEFVIHLAKALEIPDSELVKYNIGSASLPVGVASGSSSVIEQFKAGKLKGLQSESTDLSKNYIKKSKPKKTSTRDNTRLISVAVMFCFLSIIFTIGFATYKWKSNNKIPLAANRSIPDLIEVNSYLGGDSDNFEMLRKYKKLSPSELISHIEGFVDLDSPSIVSLSLNEIRSRGFTDLLPLVYSHINSPNYVVVKEVIKLLTTSKHPDKMSLLISAMRYPDKRVKILIAKSILSLLNERVKKRKDFKSGLKKFEKKALFLLALQENDSKLRSILEKILRILVKK